MRSPFLGGLAALVALSACTVTPPALPEPAGGSSASSNERLEVVAENLDVPWGIAFLPDGDMLVTERPGTLLRIGKNNRRHEIEGVRHVGEGGLLGVALHPKFAENRWIYLYFTEQTQGGIRNRVERYVLEDDRLSDGTDILTGIPGAQNHDGGRLAFGPDGYLYVATGDAAERGLAQDTASLAGKILRIDDRGKPAPDNPFGTAVYSYGHRNPQGLTWDDNGNLWSTEHGQSSFDELNRIEPGKNYGWPAIEAAQTQSGMTAPMLFAAEGKTWAPASAAYFNGSVFFGGLRGEALYQAVLAGDEPLELRVHLAGMYGRIREVVVGPDGWLYFTTSNTDGRGSPGEKDDRVIRVDPSMF